MRIIVVLLITISVASIAHSIKDDLDFEIEDEPEKPGGVFGVSAGSKQQSLQESLLRAMQKPALKEQIGQVIPILRVMSPQQRLTLAALVSAQIMGPEKANQQSLAEVAQMFTGTGQAPKNVSEQLLLPISMDIAKMFKSMAAAGSPGRSWKYSTIVPWGESSQSFPTSPFPRPTMPRVESTEKTFTTVKHLAKLNGKNEINRRNGLGDVEDNDTPPNSQDCDFLTTDICQEVSHYPEAEIMGSIQKHLTMMEPFLTEHGDLQKEERETPRSQRRQDDLAEGNELGAGEGFMCPSSLKYAKPKRARTTSGAWKYIVNTGEYNQTLRLEICTKSRASCSFLNDQFQSECQQVYNYHRLMCWDERRGLHMDVFKVPSCCSCHIQGYSTKYPPEFAFAEKRREVVPIQQSSSGVKREIPRPFPFRERPEPSFFESHDDDRVRPSMDFPDEDLSESQHYPQRVPGRPFVFKEQSPPRQPNPNKVPIYNQKPQYSAVDPTNEPGQRFPDRQSGGNRPYQGNYEVQRPKDQPISHLVPPGPPLPLDFDRPRPSFDQRRKNETFNRGPEYNVVMEPMHNNKRGTQKYEQTLSKPQSPQRGKRPSAVKPVVEPAVASADNRPQYKPSADGSYGSKIRGQRPQSSQKPVFVTPSPGPADREGFEQSVRVTPKPNYKIPPSKLAPSKPPKKIPQNLGPSKKVNYNYHPIIDFFTRDAGQPQFAGSPGHRVAPVQFNRRQHVDQEPVQQYVDPQQPEAPNSSEDRYNEQHVKYSSPPRPPTIKTDHLNLAPHREHSASSHRPGEFSSPQDERYNVRHPSRQDQHPHRESQRFGSPPEDQYDAPSRQEERYVAPEEHKHHFSAPHLEENEYSVPHVQRQQLGAHEWTPI